MGKTPQIATSCGGLDLILGPTQVTNPNGTSIGSALASAVMQTNNSWTDPDAIWEVESWGPRNHVLVGVQIPNGKGFMKGKGGQLRACLAVVILYVIQKGGGQHWYGAGYNWGDISYRLMCTGKNDFQQNNVLEEWAVITNYSVNILK